jgi:hypothetical protein
MEHPTSIGECYGVLKDTENKGITDEILRVCEVIVIHVFGAFRVYGQGKVIDKFLSEGSQLCERRLPFREVCPSFNILF